MNKMSNELENDQLIVHFYGEIDSANVAYYKVKLQDLLARNAIRNLTIDLSKVDFIDSAGIGLILGRYNEMNHVNGKVYLFGLNNEMMKLMEISGVTKIIKCEQKSYKVKS